MRLLLLSSLILMARSVCGAEPQVPLDPVTGMKMTGDWEIVRNHCIICHSPKTFLQQRGTESTWTDTLVWMQKHGGLWKLDPAVEKTIVAYLAANYGPGDTFRRAPIPLSLMPANPYATEAKLEAEAKKKAGLVPTAPPPPGVK
ncbi:MAG TPA: hypothetical protein VGE39_03855 [Prosthecobacter sp.]